MPMITLITEWRRDLFEMMSQIFSQQEVRRGVSRLGRVATLSLFLVVFICSISLAVPICGSCGYENGDTARFCSHCGQNLKTAIAKPAGPATEPGDEPPVSDAIISPDAVTLDMRTAHKVLDSSDVALATLFARNALALNLLAGSDDNERRADAIVKFIDKCERLEGRVKRRCPVCSGTGKAVMTARSLSGSKRSFLSNSGQCERCSGAGSVRGSETVDERKYHLGQAVEKYRTLQQNAGRVPVALAWVPSKSVSELDLFNRVALKRAIPPSCSRCVGVGRSDCTTCRGSGKSECSAKGCVRGKVEREKVGGTIGDSDSGVNAIYTVDCQVCRGRGLESCEKCSGAGSFICKECNGSGGGAMCSKCSGSGILSCRRCLGSLIYRGEPCKTCAAYGSVECSSCTGTGRKR